MYDGRFSRNAYRCQEEGGFVDGLLEMPLLAASAPRAALPTIWNVPYPRNPFFLGREQELTQIHQQLQRSLAMALYHLNPLRKPLHKKHRTLYDISVTVKGCTH